MIPVPTNCRHSEGYFKVQSNHVAYDRRKASHTGSNKKFLLMQLSEKQNHRCAYCGERLVFWWELQDISSLWLRKATPNRHRAQRKLLDAVANLAVFEYHNNKLAGYKKHLDENMFVACQSCQRHRTLQQRPKHISIERFAEISADPVRWALFLKYPYKARKKKAKVPAYMFKEGVGKRLNKTMFDNVETLLAIDLEWYEYNERKVLEVGLTRFTRRGRTTARHIIIRDYLKVKNKRFVPNKKDHFHHGDSELLRKNEAATVVLEELSKVDGVVVHGGDDKDLVALKYIGLNVDPNTIVYDTQKLFSMLLGVRAHIRLGRVSELFQHNLIDPHNAGNDAFATAKAFIGMCKVIESNQKISYKGHRKCGTFFLDSIEITT